MRLRIKVYVAFAAAILLAVTIAWLWSNHSIARLERESRDARQHAETLQQHAAQKEMEATQFKQKIEYLNAISNNARADVERARRTRSVAVTADQLCQKLAELGHAC